VEGSLNYSTVFSTSCSLDSISRCLSSTYSSLLSRYSMVTVGVVGVVVYFDLVVRWLVFSCYFVFSSISFIFLTSSVTACSRLVI
jgi:hypothetical protein